MAVKEVQLKDVDCSVIYITSAELARELNMTPQGVKKYIKDHDFIDGFYINRTKYPLKSARGLNVFIHPDEADKFRRLVKSGLVETGGTFK